MVQRLHGGAASSAWRSNAEAAARVCAVVVKESRVRGRSWGILKGAPGVSACGSLRARARFPARCSGGRTREERKGMDPTREPGRAERNALREGGNGLTGGASLTERGKRAQLREERRRHVGPAGQTPSGDSGQRAR